MGICHDACRTQQLEWTVKDRELLKNLPQALMNCAKFIQTVEHDYDFLRKMHYYRRTQQVHERFTVVWHEGFHEYDLKLYWPIIENWVATRWNHRIKCEVLENNIGYFLHFSILVQRSSTSSSSSLSALQTRFTGKHPNEKNRQ